MATVLLILELDLFTKALMALVILKSEVRIYDLLDINDHYVFYNRPMRDKVIGKGYNMNGKWLLSLQVHMIDWLVNKTDWFCQVT